MTLKLRMTLVMGALILAFVGADAFLLLLQLRARAGTETASAVRSIAALLPSESAFGGDSAGALAVLARQISEAGHVRHARVSLYATNGELVASSLDQRREVPPFLRREDRTQPGVRKDVLHAGSALGYWEVVPAEADELAELWDEFVDNVAIIAMVGVPALALVVWFTFRTFAPVDRIRDALRGVQQGRHELRLIPSGNADLDEIVRAFNSMAESLDAAHARTQSFLRRLLESDEQTRRAVAHDLHDALSPYLVAMQPLARVLQRRVAAEPSLADLASAVDEAVAYQSRILATLRRILMGLHPPELETAGLRAAIGQLVEQENESGKHSMRIQYLPAGTWDRFSPTIDANVYRIVQECITNAQRHSAATACSIAMTLDQVAGATERSLRVEVLNDGVTQPGAPAKTGIGTLSMRDRALALGGQIEAGPAGAEGWRVCVQIPVDQVFESPEEIG